MNNRSKTRYRKKENHISATNQLIKLIRDDEPFLKEPDDGTTKIIDLGYVENEEAYQNRDLLPILYQGKSYKGNSLLYLGIGILLLIIITFASIWVFSNKLKSIQEKKDLIAKEFNEQTHYLSAIPPLEEKKQMLMNIEKTYEKCQYFKDSIMSLSLKELIKILPSNIIPQKIALKKSQSMLELEGILLRNSSYTLHDVKALSGILEDSPFFSKTRILYHYPYNRAQIDAINKTEAIRFCLESFYSHFKDVP